MVLIRILPVNDGRSVLRVVMLAGRLCITPCCRALWCAMCPSECLPCYGPTGMSTFPPRSKSTCICYASVVLGDVAELALEVGVMLHIRLAGEAFSLAFQTPDAQVHVLRGEHLLGILLNVPHDARHVKDALGPHRAEPGRTGKHDKRMDMRGWYEV